MEEGHIIVLNVNMKNNSKLICITGFMGVGKSSVINFFSDCKYDVFKMDEYIHSIYLKEQIGYIAIEKEFGTDFVNENQVDRNKLRSFILESSENVKKLNNLMFPIIEKKLQDLVKLDKTIVVELGIFVYNPKTFSKYFKKIIAITSNRENKIDFFETFHNGLKFSTKSVENYENLEKEGIILVDFIVENNSSLINLQKNFKKILKKI